MGTFTSHTIKPEIIKIRAKATREAAGLDYWVVRRRFKSYSSYWRRKTFKTKRWCFSFKITWRKWGLSPHNSLSTLSNKLSRNLTCIQTLKWCHHRCRCHSKSPLCSSTRSHLGINRRHLRRWWIAMDPGRAKRLKISTWSSRCVFRDKAQTTAVLIRLTPINPKQHLAYPSNRCNFSGQQPLRNQLPRILQTRFHSYQQVYPQVSLKCYVNATYKDPSSIEVGLPI